MITSISSLKNVLATALPASIAPPAAAQNVLEEMVVAQKREETWTSLQRLNANDALNGQANPPRTWSVEVQYGF